MTNDLITDEFYEDEDLLHLQGSLYNKTISERKNRMATTVLRFVKEEDLFFVEDEVDDSKLSCLKFRNSQK